MEDIERDRPAPPPLTDPAARFRRAHEGAQPSAPGVGVTVFQSCMIAGCATVLVPFLLVGGFFITVFLLISSGMDDASSSSFDSFMSGSTGSNLRERVIRPGDGDAGTVAIIAVTGAIDGNGSPLEGDGAMAHLSEQMRAAGENKDVMAVILQIDSPGGGLTASDQLHNEVTKLKAKGKHVLAWAGGMMASGGYYIAAGADGIMASPTSTVGSIGVIMRHFQVAEMLRKIGVATDPIISGERKDLGSPFREMTPAERELLQDYIDHSHRRFVEIVAEGRGMEVDEVAKLADGGIFTAEAARENGLIDRIGYIEDALEWAEDLSGSSNMRVISYRRLASLGDLFREAGSGAAGAVVEAAGAESAPRAMAIWDAE